MKAGQALLVAVTAAVALTSAAAAGPDTATERMAVAAGVVSDWNAIAQAETIPLRPTAHGQMRGIAMVQGAVYDAVNAIDRSRKPYLLDLKRVRIGRRRLTGCSCRHGRVSRAPGDHAYDSTRGSRHRVSGHARCDSGRA